MTKVLDHFQQMVKTQYAFEKHGSIGERARQRGGAEAKLMLTGTPRGSFGLELLQPNPHDLFSSEHLSKSLVQLTQLNKAAERVAAVTTKPEKIELKGEFRGAALDTWRFDFRNENGVLISGKLSADVSEDDAAAMNQLTAREYIGQFERVKVIARGGIVKERFELLAIKAAEDPF